jgi:hypothetical protein
LRALYLDTALLVATLIHEPGTAVAHRFLRQASDRTWLISPWADAELASALAMQGRRAGISGEERDTAWQRFQGLRQQRLQGLPWRLRISTQPPACTWWRGHRCEPGTPCTWRGVNDTAARW